MNQDGTVNSPTNPAPGGSYIAIYGTGGGQTKPASVTGQVAQSAALMLAGPVTATIGGASATVSYAGPAPGLLSSVFQANLLVPTGAGSGGVPLILTVGGRQSQSGVIVWVK